MRLDPQPDYGKVSFLQKQFPISHLERPSKWKTLNFEMETIEQKIYVMDHYVSSTQAIKDNFPQGLNYNYDTLTPTSKQCTLVGILTKMVALNSLYFITIYGKRKT